MEKPEISLIIRNAAQLLTCGESVKDSVGLKEHTSLAVAGEKIVFVGKDSELEKRYDASNATVLDATDKTVLPGFVDCHTHLVFGGSRIEEYVARLTCDDTRKIQARGVKTGLAASMEMTARETQRQLTASSLRKLHNMLKSGTTTAEIKSGYGLRKDVELKQLRVIRDLKDLQPIDICATFLGAHGWPPDADKTKYLEQVACEMLPEVAQENLAEFCDIWCDDGYYTAKECAYLLAKARSCGLKLKIHTDAYSYIGGSDLAAEMGMISADHLNYTPPAAADKLKEAGVCAVFLPGTDFSVNHPRPFDPAPMLGAGMRIALGTNLNPGNWIESMQFILALACRRHRMKPEEAVRAATFGGACALGLERDRGSLEEGKLADIQIWSTSDYRDVVYKPGGNLVETVIKRGRVCYDIHGGF